MKSTVKPYQWKTNSFVVFILILIILVTGCKPAAPAAAPASDDTAQGQADNSGPDYTGKKILWVNSYHTGYAWSDGIEAGLHEVLDGTGVELKIVEMDTKRNSDEAFGQSAGMKAKAEIEAFQPDVVIASDDNAQKYLIVPFFKGTEQAVVFNGVNWDASAYGYPTSNVTGMVEVELPDQLVELLKAHANGERIGYLTIDTETERKVVDTYNQRFFDGQLQPYWVTTQDEFKTAFLAAQQEVDILFMGNNAGSDTWDEEAMQQFVLKNATVPTGSINDWMSPYSLLTLAKSAKEQGVWSAQAALQIIDGTPVSEISVTENKKGEMIVNLDLADKLGVVFAPSLLKNALILGQ